MMNGLKNILLYSWVAFRATSSRLGIRMDCRKNYRAHKDTWEPLTRNEKKLTPRLDRPSYVTFKNVTGIGGEDLRYFLPDAPYFTHFLTFLNPLNHTLAGKHIDSYFTDKNYMDLLMPELLRPKTIVHCIKGCFYDDSYRRITDGEAIKLLSHYEEAVFKQTKESCHGEGVRPVSQSDYAEILKSFGEDYVVQERISQNEWLDYFNPTSVNVIRVTTLFWDGFVYVLGCILRVGAPGSFCDHLDSGGNYRQNIAIYADASLSRTAYEVTNFKTNDSIFGKPIPETFPFYDAVIDAAVRGHEKFPHFGLIGWDFTVDRDGNPVCIEFNTKFPGLTETQYSLGPVLKQPSRKGVPLLDEIRSAIAETRPF